MRKTGIAIIGTGNICPAHIQGYLKSADRCRIAVLCDIYVEKAKRIATRFALEGVDIVEDYHDILGRDDIDAVSLCLPPSLHSRVACDFLAAGKHVVSEKPMASSLEEADAMIAAQQKSGKVLSIISQNRFRTATMRMKRLLDSGMLGPVEFAQVSSMWWRGNNYYDLWWRGTWEKECGGCTINHAVHQIDILQYLVGMPDAVTGIIANVAHDNSEVEDLSVSILRYPKMLAQITASLVDHDEHQQYAFHTHKATVTIPWSVHCVKQKPNGFFDPDPESERKIQEAYEALPAVADEGHPAQLRDFLDAIEEGRSPLVDGTEGKKALELITAIYKSAAEHTASVLPLEQDDPYYRKETMLARMPRFHKKARSVENLEDDVISLGNMDK